MDCAGGLFAGTGLSDLGELMNGLVIFWVLPSLIVALLSSINARCLEAYPMERWDSDKYLLWLGGSIIWPMGVFYLIAEAVFETGITGKFYRWLVKERIF